MLDNGVARDNRGMGRVQAGDGGQAEEQAFGGGVERLVRPRISCTLHRETRNLELTHPNIPL